MSNATMARFGYPATTVAQYEHWVVLLRPQPVTLASLVLAAKAEVTAFSQLSTGAFAEQQQVIGDIETALAGFVSYEKINYLMLMMVDPHVHFHVLPRYAGVRNFGGVDFSDYGWPGMPDLSKAQTLEESLSAAMVEALRSVWPARGTAPALARLRDEPSNDRTKL